MSCLLALLLLAQAAGASAGPPAGAPRPDAASPIPVPVPVPVPAPAPAAQRVLTLEEALSLARERQPQLRQAHAGTQAAAARARGSFAPLLPQVSATAGYLRTTSNAISRPGQVLVGSSGHSETDTFNSWSDSVTANQLIYDFGQSTGRYRAAEAQASATAQTERATLLQIVLAVRSAFYTARANKSLLVVAKETLQNQQRHLVQTQGFVEAGTHPDIELAQARTNVSNAQVQVITADNNYAVARTSLNNAMGVEGSIDYDVADQAAPQVAGEDANDESLVDEAIKARPEIASLQESVRAQQATLASVRGGYGPALGAQVGFTQGGTALDSLGWNLSAGVTLTWQLYQGGLTNAQVNEQEALVGQVLAQLDSQRQALRLEVEQARLAVRGALASQGAARDAVQSAREQLRLAEGRFETGVGNEIELSDAQLAATNAGVQAVQAEYQLATARAQLLKALGRQ